MSQLSQGKTIFNSDMFEQAFAFADATPSAEEVQIRNKQAAMFLATLLGISFEYLR